MCFVSFFCCLVWGSGDFVYTLRLCLILFFGSVWWGRRHALGAGELVGQLTATATDAIVCVDVMVFYSCSGVWKLIICMNFFLVSRVVYFLPPTISFGLSLFIHNGRPHSLPLSSNIFILLGIGFSFLTFGGLTFGRASALGNIPPNDPNGGVSS